jgi:hypothetical protein
MNVRGPSGRAGGTRRGGLGPSRPATRSLLVVAAAPLGVGVSPAVGARSAAVATTASASRPATGFPAVSWGPPRWVSTPASAPSAPEVGPGREGEPVPARAALSDQLPVGVRGERERRPALPARPCVPHSLRGTALPSAGSVVVPTPALAGRGRGRRGAPLGHEGGDRFALGATDLERAVRPGGDRQGRTALRTLGPPGDRGGRVGRGDLFPLGDDRSAEREWALDQRGHSLAVGARAGQHARLLHGVGDLGTAARARTHVVHPRCRNTEASLAGPSVRRAASEVRRFMAGGGRRR